MKKYAIREVRTNQELGYAYAEDKRRATGMAYGDQRDGIFCKKSKFGVKLSELDVDEAAWTVPTEPSILWF